jgi:hypothetical protein
MDISLFPKGKYIVRSETLNIKSKGKPYGIELQPNNKESIPKLWDLGSFRPDILSLQSSNLPTDVFVLYENINTCKCCKIPRYIYADNKWFVNVR